MAENDQNILGDAETQPVTVSYGARRQEFEAAEWF